MEDLTKFKGSYANLYRRNSIANPMISKMASMTNLNSSTKALDPMQLMTLQDDANCRRISTEVIRQSLHRNVTPVGARRRLPPHRSRRHPHSILGARWSRFSEANTPNHIFSPYLQSCPITPAAYSIANSREASPTRSVINAENQENEYDGFEDETRGLAALLKPKPRYLAACTGSRTTLCGLDFEAEVQREFDDLREESISSLSSCFLTSTENLKDINA